MALTVEVAKLWPRFDPNGLFYVGVEIVLKDDGAEVRRASFTEATNKNADVTEVGNLLLKDAQEWINAYKTEKQAFNHEKYEQLRSTIEDGLII